MNIKNKLMLLSTSLLTLPARVFADDGGSATDGTDYLKGVLELQPKGQESALNGVNDTLKTILGFARGAGVIVCVIMLVWCAIQLAASAGNNQKRQVAMEGIKNVLIAVAIIGGATIIASLAYGILVTK